MPKVSLTDRYLKSLKPAPAGKRIDHLDAIVPGLALIVTDKGAKSFVLIDRFPGSSNPTRRKLGNYGALSLEAARKKARGWIELLQAGVDPKTVELEAARTETKRRADTFVVIAGHFFDEKLSSERKGREVERDIRNEFFPEWADRPITSITPLDVQTIIKGIKARGAPHQARNVLGHAKRFFDWVIDQNVYGLTTSPCERLKPAKLIGKKRARSRILSDVELFAFWRAIRRLGYPYRAIYELLLFTGLRLNEVADARWDEFDRQNAAWIIPEQRMKGRDEDAREHVVPITAEVAQVLDDLPRFKAGRYLFSSTFGRTPIWVSDKIKKKIDRRMLHTLTALARRRGENVATVSLDRWTNHDLRRTLRSGLSKLRVDRDVREAVLGHALKGIEGVYDRYDFFVEKKDALERWAAHVRGIVEPADATSNVVSIAEARR